MKKKLAINIIVALLMSFAATSVSSATPVDAPSSHQPGSIPSSHQPGSIDNRGYGLTDTAWDDVKWSTTPSDSHNNQYPPYLQMRWSTWYASYSYAWSNLPNYRIETIGQYNGYINYYYTWSSIVPNNLYEVLIQVIGVGNTGDLYNMQVRYYAYDPVTGNSNPMVLDNIGLTV